MPTLPAELLNLIVAFAPLFSQPVFQHAQVLVLGARLSRGTRTVTACLRVLGLRAEVHFQNYHRVLNRARWQALSASRILLGLLVARLSPGSAIVLAADDTTSAAAWPPDQGRWVLSCCGALFQTACRQVFWLEVALGHAVGARAVEQSGVGLAGSFGAVSGER